MGKYGPNWVNMVLMGLNVVDMGAIICYNALSYNGKGGETNMPKDQHIKAQCTIDHDYYASSEESVKRTLENLEQAINEYNSNLHNVQK